MAIRYLLSDQLRYLAALGYEVAAICGTRDWTGPLNSSGFDVYEVPLSRRIDAFADVRALGAITAQLRRLQPLIVHTHTPKASLLGQWAARIAGVPHRVHTIHGLYFPTDVGPMRRRAYALLERFTMAPADLILSQSREDVDTCLRERLCDS